MLPPEACADALAGLQHLAVVEVDIKCLAVHAAFGSLTQLTSLRELHIEMVGAIGGLASLRDGLPCLAGLSLMELHTNVRAVRLLIVHMIRLWQQLMPQVTGSLWLLDSAVSTWHCMSIR